MVSMCFLDSIGSKYFLMFDDKQREDELLWSLFLVKAHDSRRHCSKIGRKAGRRNSIILILLALLCRFTSSIKYDQPESKRLNISWIEKS